MKVYIWESWDRWHADIIIPPRINPQNCRGYEIPHGKLAEAIMKADRLARLYNRSKWDEEKLPGSILDWQEPSM